MWNKFKITLDCLKYSNIVRTLYTEVVSVYMQGDEVAEVLSDSVNGGINPEELQDQLQIEHPYLQAEIVNQVILPAIEAISNAPQVDARNQRAVDTCSELLEVLEESPTV